MLLDKIFALMIRFNGKTPRHSPADRQIAATLSPEKTELLNGKTSKCCLNRIKDRVFCTFEIHVGPFAAFQPSFVLKCLQILTLMLGSPFPLLPTKIEFFQPQCDTGRGQRQSGIRNKQVFTDLNTSNPNLRRR